MSIDFNEFLSEDCTCQCQYCTAYFSNHKKCKFECDGDLWLKGEY